MTTATTEAAPTPTYRKDYTPPAFWIDRVHLEFDLGETGTEVRARLELRRNPDAAADASLELNGEDLETLGLKLDGRELQAGEWEETAELLTLRDLPATCVLETRVQVHPEKNFQLSGLYQSSGNFCTQCEAEGFRRITWFLDRPDVMARYTTEITGDPERYPVMLSNGNRLGEEVLTDGRKRVRWEDPFPKPSYLFALVAGKLHCHAGEFKTKSGRKVALEIYVEPQNADKCDHALLSLQQSMDWDEKTFGLEYDLDLYMIVAVGDFNMGAMENKGLNVFNSKYVLAAKETATDDDFESVQAVIAHEYFHNWTGNRVTCRDWFQLTLKEGLTVFRDQQFTADHTSAAVKRIDDVRMLRLRQFPEDSGPMAHPIRPESYIAMDNFYTATVYDKGAEVIRMYHTLLGAEGFRKGMDLYFERHDNQAVTCDDFRAAMSDANGFDLKQFERWYVQAGTPIVAVEAEQDEAAGTLTLRFAQKAPGGQPGEEFSPMLIPMRLGLIGADGQDLPLILAGETEGPTERVLELREGVESFVFTGLSGRPVPSLLRGLSAPVDLEFERSDADLAFQLAHDSDSFNRWDAGQALFGKAILDLTRRVAAGQPLELGIEIIDAFQRVLLDDTLDGSMRAFAVSLPSERLLAQSMEVIDPDALHTARSFVRAELAKRLVHDFRAVYNANRTDAPYDLEKASIDRRRIANAALGFLGALEGTEGAELAATQLDASDNMTDAEAALAVLVQLDVPQRETALEAFYTKWKDEPLVLDKWFTLQACSTLPGAPERVEALSKHSDFTLLNPNRARSLIGAFAMANQVGFNDKSGAGYRFLADAVIVLQAQNPQIAARLVGSFNHWKRFDAGRQALMRGELERIRAVDGLSKDVGEIVGRALGS